MLKMMENRLMEKFIELINHTVKNQLSHLLIIQEWVLFQFKSVMTVIRRYYG